jgi:hypothetical protein
MVLHDATDDVMGRLRRVVMTDELRTPVEGWFEVDTGEFLFTSFTDALLDFPHIFVTRMTFLRVDSPQS